MHRSSLAPELSATLRRVSCWIILLLSLLNNLKYAPAFLLGDGARFGDANKVADAALVLLVVDLELGAVADSFLVEAVRLGRADLDDHRLVHLVRDHGAQPDLALAASVGVGGGRWLGWCRHAHESCSAFAFEALALRLGLAPSPASEVSCAFLALALALGSATATATASGATCATMPNARSWSTVMMRAMSWRTLEIWLEFSSWPTACLNLSS